MAQHILKPGDFAQPFDFTDVGGTFTVTSGNTVYYGATQSVTSTSFDGSVALSGTSPTLYGVQWLVVDRASSGLTRIEKTAGQPASAVANEQRLTLVETRTTSLEGGTVPAIRVTASGLTDATDFNAVQAAVTAAEAAAASGKAVTVLLDGFFTLNKSGTEAVQMTPNNSGTRGWITITGTAGTRVTLTSNTRRFLHLAKSADYDTFQKIRVTELEIDAGNVTHRGAAVLGCLVNAGTQPRRLNFKDITVRNVRVINAYEEASTATSQVFGVLLIAMHDGAPSTVTTSSGSPNLTSVTPTTGWVNGMVVAGPGIPTGTTIVSGAGTATMVMSANATASASGVAIGGLETTQTSTTNITIDGLEINGGAGCFNVCSWGAGTLIGGINHYYDNLRASRCRHVNATAPDPTGGNGYQTSFFWCGTGFGDYCEMVDCYSKNVADDAVEIGAMQRVHLERVRDENAYIQSILFRNSHALQDVSDQLVTLVDCQHSVSAAAVAATQVGLTKHQWLWWIQDQGASGFGTFKVVRPTASINGMTTAKSFPDSYFISANGIAIDRLEVTQAKVKLKNFTADRATPHDVPPVIYWNPTTAGARLAVRDLEVKHESLTVSSASAVTLPILRLDGTDTTLVLDGIHVEIPATTFTGGGAVQLIPIGRASGMKVRGRIRGLVPKVGTITGGGVYGVFVNSTTNLTIDTELTISELNGVGFSNLNTEVSIDSTQRGKVKLTDCTLKTTPTAANQAPGASPYTYANSAGYPQLVTVSGGTVSDISVQAVSGGSQSTGLTSGSFVLRAGDLLIVTYSVAPTMKILPLN